MRRDGAGPGVVVGAVRVVGVVEIDVQAAIGEGFDIEVAAGAVGLGAAAGVLERQEEAATARVREEREGHVPAFDRERKAAPAKVGGGFAGAGLLLLIAITVIELKDLFTSQAVVQDYNNGIMERIYRALVKD